MANTNPQPLLTLCYLLELERHRATILALHARRMRWLVLWLIEAHDNPFALAVAADVLAENADALAYAEAA